MSSSCMAAKTLNRTRYSNKKTNDVTELGGRMIRGQVGTVVHDDRPMAPRALLLPTPAPQRECRLHRSQGDAMGERAKASRPLGFLSLFVSLDPLLLLAH